MRLRIDADMAWQCDPFVHQSHAWSGNFVKVINESPSRPWNKPVNVDRLRFLEAWKELVWEGQNLKSNLCGPSIINSRRDVQVWGLTSGDICHTSHMCGVRASTSLKTLDCIDRPISLSLHLLTVPRFQSHCPRATRFASCCSMRLPPHMLLNYLPGPWN